MNAVKIKRYRALLAQLVLSSALIGGLFTFFLNLPLLLLGLVFRPFWLGSHKMTLIGLTALRKVQPWWRGQIKIDLPPEVLEGEKGCLCVSNHRSHLDVFMMLQQIPGVRVLTKHLIFLIPGLGQAAVLMRMIRIKRGASESFWRAMERVEKALSEKDRVLVFPEMTRSQFGDSQLARFTLAPFQKAIAADVPVLPIVIWGTDYLWPRGVYGIAMAGPLIVESLEPVNARDFSSAEELSNHVKNKIQLRVLQLSKLHPYGDFV